MLQGRINLFVDTWPGTPGPAIRKGRWGRRGHTSLYPCLMTAGRGVSHLHYGHQGDLEGEQ